jgi:hypothetical protein
VELSLGFVALLVADGLVAAVGDGLVAAGGADWSVAGDCAKTVAPITPPKTRVERPRLFAKLTMGWCLLKTE